MPRISVYLTFLYIYLLAFSPMASSESKDIHIHSMSPNVDVNKFGSSYTKHAYKAQKKSSTLPEVKDRDAVFKKADLTAETSKMDHLDKDLLYLRAKKYSIEKLISVYPSIASSKLTALKSAVLKQK